MGNGQITSQLVIANERFKTLTATNEALLKRSDAFLADQSRQCVIVS